MFGWSEQSQRYVGPDGRFVPGATIDAAVDAVIERSAQRMVTLTEQLQAGSVTLAEWQQRIAAEMKALHLGAAAMGRGGWQQMDQSAYGWVGRELRSQYGWLRGFAADIAEGRQPADGRLIMRAAMYAHAARGTQREMQRRMARGIGRTEERNVLGAADRHCSPCLSATGAGWVPIGTLPRIGARQCLSRCRCRIETRAA